MVDRYKMSFCLLTVTPPEESHFLYVLNTNLSRVWFFLI